MLTRARAVGLCDPYAVTVLDLYTSNPPNDVRTATTRQVRMKGSVKGRTDRVRRDGGGLGEGGRKGQGKEWKEAPQA